MKPIEDAGRAADPARPLDELRELATGCRACDLWRNATQTVFGAGDERAELLLIGEQPGDREDVSGEPFVGPAGRLLDRALDEAGIDRTEVYVTNVVKHFKWRRAPRGKRRIHQRPDRAEVQACRPWLQAEIARVRPRLVVCLGATAAREILGPAFRVTRDSGQVVETLLGPPGWGTIHPSAILRMTGEQRDAAWRQFVDELRGAAATAATLPLTG